MDHPIRSPHQLRALLVGFIKTAGQNQRVIARELGVTPQAVSKALRQPQTMSIQSLMKMLAVLGVELVLRKDSTPQTASPQEW